MNGSDRAIVPIGIYEEVFPQDLLVSLLLRAIVIKDTEQIQLLGGLELDEEDLSLCSYVCPICVFLACSNDLPIFLLSSRVPFVAVLGRLISQISNVRDG